MQDGMRRCVRRSKWAIDQNPHEVRQKSAKVLQGGLLLSFEVCFGPFPSIAWEDTKAHKVILAATILHQDGQRQLQVLTINLQT